LRRASAVKIAAEVRAGKTTAEAVTAAALADIAARNPEINAFTAVLADRALADARALDARIAEGRPAGPLAGVPFAVKNLFDVAGLVTLAGSKILADRAPAGRDAPLVARLKAAGAILLGALNMDEFAYGFVTENAHYGPTRNPHDLSRIAGGSSGGSAASVAAGLVPLSLGSDTNGSVRVPAGLCGVFGLRPTYGALPSEGMFPFVRQLDAAGPFARSLDDLATAWDVLGGEAADGPVAPRLTALAQAPLRVGALGGWFVQGAASEVMQAYDDIATALGAETGVALAGAEAARSAAFCLSAHEGGRLHLAELRRRAQDYDPAVRDRLIAGALLPQALADEAMALQPLFRRTAARLFERFDVLLAPATPCPAPPIGQATMMIDGESVSVRKNLGAYTQPISFIGLPVLTAPVNRPGRLPIGIQIITDHGREDLAFAAAARLAERGVVAAHAPAGFA
jgi:aspartyl-tRNA(Asn)/glutamyl-tRNA(Gln) amidotransferase subunit A